MWAWYAKCGYGVQYMGVVYYVDVLCNIWVSDEICQHGVQYVDMVCNIWALYIMWMCCVIFG